MIFRKLPVIQTMELSGKNDFLFLTVFDKIRTIYYNESEILELLKRPTEKVIIRNVSNMSLEVNTQELVLSSVSDLKLTGSAKTVIIKRTDITDDLYHRIRKIPVKCIGPFCGGPGLTKLIDTGDIQEFTFSSGELMYETKRICEIAGTIVLKIRKQETRIDSIVNIITALSYNPGKRFIIYVDPKKNDILLHKVISVLANTSIYFRILEIYFPYPYDLPFQTQIKLFDINADKKILE